MTAATTAKPKRKRAGVKDRIPKELRECIVQPDLRKLRLRNPVDGAHVVKVNEGQRTEVLALSDPRPAHRSWRDPEPDGGKRKKGKGRRANKLVGVVFIGGRAKRA